MRFILDAHKFLFSFNYREINWRSPKTWGVVALIVLALVGIFSWAFSGDEAVVETENTIREVRVASVSELMGGGSALSAVAEIQSVNEAKISPEMGGRIVRVRATLGDRVAAGQILAEIENASQRAAVLQAEGIFEAAKAALSKVQGGTREEQLSILETAVDGAKGSVVTTLLSAYGTMNSSIEGGTDQMFNGIEMGQINFIVPTSNQQTELELEHQRDKFITVLSRENANAKSLTKNSDLETELSTTEAELRTARTFMDTILKALADAIPNDNITASEIATFKSEATAARAALTASLSAVAGARSALEVAKKNLEQGVTGAQSQDVAGATAAVKQAQGSYNAALANLEKTILRSPISGTLNNFTIKLGDTVAPSQQVAIVSNNNALEGIMYVTEEDTNRIAVGQKVSLEGDIQGTITKIAPALDPVTRRIEVRIGLPADAKIGNGESVRVTIAKDPLAKETVTGPLTIPITALRMEANRSLVFAVENNLLVAKEVEIGKLSGDSVQISSGLTLDSEIVVDARGLKEGKEVKIGSRD